MSDLSPPIRLPVSRFLKGGGILKVKRGGTGKISNSGNAAGRFYTPCKGLRIGPKKPGKHKGGTLEPKPPRAPAIWNPTDPIIVAYREAHPRVEAKWRFYQGRVARLSAVIDIETRAGGPDV